MKEKGQKKRKNWQKPPKAFKTVMKKSRRAKEKQALRDGRDIPLFKHTDTWDYN